MCKVFKDGEPYRPSNGTEGMMFHDKFCSHCIHDHPTNEKRQCELIMYAMCFDVDEKEYPKEWVYKDDYGICTKFQHWDWGNDGDPDDEDNPKAPLPPPDPNQLNLFPLYPNETTYTDGRKASLAMH